MGTYGNRDPFATLEADWAALCRRQRRTGILTEWSRQEPALKAINTFGDLVPERGVETERAPIFGALTRLHLQGDDLAARALLQLLVPGMIRLAAQWRDTFNNAHDSAWDVISRSTIKIATYRTNRPHSPLSWYVVGSVHGQLGRRARRSARESLLLEDDSALDEDPRLTTPSAEDSAAHSGKAFHSALQNAAAERVIPHDAIPTVWLSLLGIPIEEAAERTFQSRTTAYRYRHRALGYLARQDYIPA